MALPIAVTGATGRQGGAVVRALAGAGLAVRALTRDPKSAAAHRLTGLPNVDVRRCDLEAPSAIRAALAGTGGLFLTTTPYEGGIEAEERQARAAIEAATAVGVEQLVYSSVAGARDRTGVAHFDSKGRIEQLIDGSGFRTVTILRPTFFMDMWLAPFVRGALMRGQLKMALKPATRIAMIAVEDIAAFAALAFRQPSALAGRAIDLVGDIRCMDEVAAALSAATGRPLGYVQVAPEAMAEDARPRLATQRWLEDVGWSTDVTAIEDGSIQMTDIRRWAQRHAESLSLKDGQHE